MEDNTEKLITNLIPALRSLNHKIPLVDGATEWRVWLTCSNALNATYDATMWATYDATDDATNLVLEVFDD